MLSGPRTAKPSAIESTAVFDQEKMARDLTGRSGQEGNRTRRGSAADDASRKEFGKRDCVFGTDLRVEKITACSFDERSSGL